MLIPIALVVGLLIATAVIAHVADNLGKKLGKKRVSLFGLRPRTSATIATVGTGWAIMFVTLSLLLAVVTPLRHALLYYESDRDSALKQIKAVRADLLKKQAELSGKQAELDDKQTKLNRTQAQLDKVGRSVTEYQERAEDFKEKAQTAQGNFQKARRGEQSAKRGEQDAKRASQAAQRTARIAQVSAQSAQNAADIARRQEEAAQKALKGTQQSLQKAQSRLDSAQKRLQTAKHQLTVIEESANRQIVSSGRQVVSAQREVVQAQKEVDELQKQKGDLQGQVSVLQQLVNELDRQSKTQRRDLEAIVFGDIALSVDQTLAERRFDTTRSPQEIARELNILVDAADEMAHKVLGNDKLDFVVGAAVTGDSNEPIILNQEQAIKVYANVLSSTNQTVSARLVSAYNYPSTTTVVTSRFVFVPIRTIYIARQDIAKMTIDTNKSESAIFGQLQRLVEVARINAVKNGANPPIPPELPPSSDPDAPQPESQHFFDGDTGPKLFDALREVQKFDHSVQVRIVAARDLDSAEPLQIRFIVGDEAE